MTPQGARKLRLRAGAEGFARAWDIAVQRGRDRSYEEAVRRGRDGWLSPIVRGGKVVGHRHRFDNRLLFAACYREPISRYKDANAPPPVGRWTPSCRFPGTFRAANARTSVTLV